jgi:photosystem II stability/assembly factor-like uncharacterized protein
MYIAPMPRPPDRPIRCRGSLALLALALAAAPCPVRAAASAAGVASVPASALRELHWRSIGPRRAGWATAACGVEGRPNTFYFGGAGGGIWKSDDAGQTWRALMQHESASAIGALAVAPSNPKVIYAGTGQEGARYDLMPGDGVFRSDDAGETWTHAGLEATRHIGALLVDPHDAGRVLVAAIGHAFGPNPERGVFLSTDGGRHWRATLFAGDSVGAVDLAADATAPRVVYAATWQRRMHPWLDYFQPQRGPGSGIWRSDDGGEHWSRLAGGLPTGSLGRIGLAAARGSGGRIVYASIEAAGAAAAGIWRTGDGGAHWEHVNAEGSLGSSYFGRLMVAPDDANTVYVMGQSIRRSHDGGRHFEVMRGSPGGDDYHQLWIDPREPRSMTAASDQGCAVSVNGGRSWSSWYNQPTGQFYHLGADDRFPYRVYSGQQDNGTVEVASRGPYGVIEERDWHPVGGDERDMMLPKPGEPRIVFGSGLGGGVSRFDEETRQSANVSPWPIGSYAARPGTTRYRYGWITPLAISPVAPHALYLGAQMLFRSRDDGNHWETISPDLTGARPGAGPCDDPGPEAASACGFGVISTIAPSPITANRIWVGTDDGRIRLTGDRGAHWRDVTPAAVPAWGIVFTIDPSPFDTSSAYAAVDLHRLDRHEPLLLVTHDSGRSWRTIVSGIPAGEFTSVVRADPERPGLLYAGTNRGVHVSFDDGAHWQSLALELPTTWVRDLLPHQGDLIAATQGRGLWVLDDVSPLRELAAGAARDGAHLFGPAPAVRLRSSESHDTPWPPETALGENPPAGAILDYWLARDASGPVTLTIRDVQGEVVRRFSSADAPESLGAEPYFERAWTGTPRPVSASAGLHRFVWDLRWTRPAALSYHWSIAAVRGEGTPLAPGGPLVVPGRYTVELGAPGVSLSRSFEVGLDPRVRVPQDALRAQLALAREAGEALSRAVPAQREIERRREQKRDTGALADTLARLGARDDAGLAGVIGSLAGLAAEIDAADGAPAQGVVDAVHHCIARIDGLLARWRRLEAAGGGEGVRR